MRNQSAESTCRQRTSFQKLSLGEVGPGRHREKERNTPTPVAQKEIPSPGPNLSERGHRGHQKALMQKVNQEGPGDRKGRPPGFSGRWSPRKMGQGCFLLEKGIHRETRRSGVFLLAGKFQDFIWTGMAGSISIQGGVNNRQKKGEIYRVRELQQKKKRWLAECHSKLNKDPGRKNHDCNRQGTPSCLVIRPVRRREGNSTAIRSLV